MPPRNMIARMSGAFSGLTLARQLVLLVLVTALPLILSLLLLFDRLATSERDTIRQGLLVSSKILAGLVENEVETFAAVGTTLATSPSLQQGNLTAFRDEAERALRFVPGAWLALSDPSGQQVLNTLTPTGTSLPKHAAPDVVRRGFETGRYQVGDIVYGPVARKPTTYVEIPAFKGTTPLYSLSIGMPTARFLGLITQQFESGENVGILDGNRRFVARLLDNDARIGTLAAEGWRAAIDGASEGLASTITLEGNASVTGYSQTRFGWTVGVGQRLAAIAGPQRLVLWRTGLLALSLTALSLVAASIIATRSGVGIRELAQSAKSLGDGALLPPPQPPFAEARVIGDTLVDVSAELKRRGEIIARDKQDLEIRVAQRTSELEAEVARRNETEEQLRQAQKMEAIGQLTGGIAHDFNNMLAIIIGNLEVLQRRLARGDRDVARYIVNALDGAQRSATLTQRLLAFSRQQPLMPTVIDANSLVGGMADLLRRAIGESVRLETIQAGGLWRISVDGGQLEQAVVNLAVNARDAMETGGRLTIETYNASLDDAYADTHGIPAGQYVVIAVSDNGEGMSPEVAGRAFDPFFTTKTVGKGSGLGLSQVFGFVRQSGGHVKIYSEVGHGTSIKLYLPRYTGSEALAANIPLLIGDAPGGSPAEIVVVVEDEDKVRHMVVDALRDLGYTVAHAAGGREGLDVLERIEGASLLLTDIVMPDMNGRELVDAVKLRQPNLKVLYTTGYTRNAVIHDGKLDADVNLLTKPFTIDQLAAKVRRVLDGVES